MKSLFAIIAMLILSIAGFSQQRQSASFLSGNVVTTFAGDIGYKQPGIGGGVTGEFNLPKNFAVIEDFQVVSERKTYEQDGRTVQSVTSLRYHLTPSYFVLAGVQVANRKSENVSDTVSRLRYGGGYQILNHTSLLPTARFTVEGFNKLSDQHDSRGVLVSAESYYNFKTSPFGIGVKASEYFTSFHDVGVSNRRTARYGEVEVRFLVNLSAISGY